MRWAGYQCEQSGSHDMWQWVRILSPTFLIEEVEEHKHFEGLGYRVNEQIRAPKVRVVDENGKQLGVFITAEP